MVTADEVGGDYYDIIRFDSTTTSDSTDAAKDPGRGADFKTGGLIAIGDVTGHGLNSGVLMMMVHATLRALSEIERRDLKTIYRVINKILYNFRIKTEDTRIMTLALLRYFGDGRFTLTGEHECILRIKSSKRAASSASIEALDTLEANSGSTNSLQETDSTPADPKPAFEIMPIEYGMYAGLEARISDEYLKIHEFDLKPGETIILYTDGITEAEDAAGVEFGQHGIINAAWRAAAEFGNTTSSAVANRAGAPPEGPASGICDAVMRAARRHSGAGEHEILDDYSLVVIHRRSAPRHRLQTRDRIP